MSDRNTPTLQIDYLCAYTHGFRDATDGKPSDSKSRMDEAVVPSTTQKRGMSASVSSRTITVTELAARAAQLQGDREKAGTPISNADAVRQVYLDAGVPLE